MEGDPATVWGRMEEALSLWRGPALAEFSDLTWAVTESGRLEELRLTAVERRADAGLALGHSAALVADLEAHVSAHPLREEGWRLLALALYRGGRQGDALGALRRARTVLRDELGLDLGATLQRLESDMLAQAPHLDLPKEQPVTAQRPPLRPPPRPDPAGPPRAPGPPSCASSWWTTRRWSAPVCGSCWRASRASSSPVRPGTGSRRSCSSARPGPTWC
nr:hypothetical protein GCM10020093_111350 [Planobispora longispora]